MLVELSLSQLVFEMGMADSRCPLLDLIAESKLIAESQAPAALLMSLLLV